MICKPGLIVYDDSMGFMMASRRPLGRKLREYFGHGEGGGHNGFIDVCSEPVGLLAALETVGVRRIGKGARDWDEGGIVSRKIASDFGSMVIREDIIRRLLSCMKKRDNKGIITFMNMYIATFAILNLKYLSIKYPQHIAVQAQQCLPQHPKLTKKQQHISPHLFTP